jgi:hypothetical protein
LFGVQGSLLNNHFILRSIRGKDYYPPTKPYEMSEVLSDLLEFAARFLVLGGRLVYWLPTVVDECVFIFFF